MNPIVIIEKYYKKDSISYNFLVKHSESVAIKALKIASKVKDMNPDLNFIKEASILHDIGILFVNAPSIGCFGEKEYICHGYLGRKLLEMEGFPKHALVCERHIGTGIKIKEIEDRKLPLPKRNMVPVSTEEEIICLADKFFSKNEEYLTVEKSIEYIRKEIGDRSKESLDEFNLLLKKYRYFL